MVIEIWYEKERVHENKNVDREPKMMHTDGVYIYIFFNVDKAVFFT